MQGGSSPRRRRGESSPRAVSPRDKKTVLIGEQATLKHQVSAARASCASLAVVFGPNLGHVYRLDAPALVVGRDAVDLRLPDQTVSRRHARIEAEGGQHWLVDLGSANGIAVDDQPLAPNARILLRRDMLVKLGSTLLKYSPAGDSDAHFFNSLGATARTDGLTGAMNKGYFQKTLEAHLELEGVMSLLFLDLDHFKNVNDTHGHAAGDAVLKAVANAVKPLAKSGVFARFGGEEFVVLLPDISLVAAAALAEKIRAAVEALRVAHDGKQLTVTVSLGVAELTDEMEDGAALIKAADDALYRAKKAGRNCVMKME